MFVKDERSKESGQTGTEAITAAAAREPSMAIARLNATSATTLKHTP